MKLPEPLFALINPMMKLLLHSPLHWLVSGNLMLITFTGRKSGRKFTTPVRYVEKDGMVLCFTSFENQWWRNIRGGADVVLRLKGRDHRYRANAIEGDPQTTSDLLIYYLARFPQDAAYHDIKLNRDKSLVAADLERASHHAIVVEARPAQDGRALEKSINMSNDEQEIRELVATWMAASKSGDVQKVLSLMTEDVVFLQPGQPVMRKADFAAAANAQSGAGAPQIDGSSEIREIKVLGDWAFMWTKLTVTVTPPDGGRPMIRAGHTLTILQKQHGKWLLARDANMLAPSGDRD